MKSMLLREKCHGREAVDLQGEVRVNNDNKTAPENIHKEQGMLKYQVIICVLLMLSHHQVAWIITIHSPYNIGSLKGIYNSVEGFA